jgi:hypothetical protein
MESDGQVPYSDPAVAAFVVIPALLLAALAGGTALAWRRSGASAVAARRAPWPSAPWGWPG